MPKKRGKGEVIAKKSAVQKKPEQKTEDNELSQELNSLEKIGLQKPAEKEEQEENPRQAKKIFHYETDDKAPSWFYIGSIVAAYLFTIYISIYATIHFESIEYMNIMVVFLFISLVSFFLVSAAYFIFEKKSMHSVAPILFFVGITSIMIYAFKAVDTSSLVRYSIMYTIIVAAISMYVLAARKQS